MKHYFTVVDFSMATDYNFISTIKVPFVVVSIVSPEMKDYSIPYNGQCYDVLYLRFHDILSNGHIQSLNDVGDEIVPIGDEHVEKILDFADRYDYIRDWLIHCEAGMSRSPAVALALSEIMNGQEDAEKYVKTMYPKIHNNINVRKAILNKHQERLNISG